MDKGSRGEVLLLLFAVFCIGNIAAANIALHKPATQLGTYQGYDAGRAVDGDIGNQDLLSGKCAHPFSWSSGVPQDQRGKATWWRVDLAAGDPSKLFHVEKVVINYRRNCAEYDRRIFPATIGTGNVPDVFQHTTCARVERQDSMVEVVTKQCVPEIPVRYVSIRHESSPAMTLCEVEVFGEEYTELGNIALNKAARQHGTYRHYGPEKAVDGGLNQDLLGNSCAHPHSPDHRPTWWYVDLADTNPSKTFIVTNVKIYFRINCAECEDRIQRSRIGTGISDDTTSHTLCAEVTAINNNGIFASRCRNIASPSRYLSITHPTTRDMTICEVQAFGYEYKPCPKGYYGQSCVSACPNWCYFGQCNDVTGLCEENSSPSNNIALNKPAQQLGTFKGYDAARAVDGVATQDFRLGFCAHPHSYDPSLPDNIRGTPTWWRVALFGKDPQKASVVQEVKIYFSLACAECYERTSPLTIRIGDVADVNKHRPCASVTEPTLDGVVTRTCMSTAPNKYLSIVHDSKADMIICEVFVRGYEYTKCPSGKHGQGCSQDCPDECNHSCNDITGECSVSSKPEPRNIALNKKAAQLGTYQNYGASRAVDGNTNRDLLSGSCAHPHSNDPSVETSKQGDPTWWYVDLGNGVSTYSVVTNVEVHFRTNCADCAPRIYVSTIRTGTDINQVLSSSSKEDTVCAYITDAMPVASKRCAPSRAVRYVAIVHETSPDMTICEVIVHGYAYKQCEAGKYGEDCAHNCPSGCANNCNDITGDCGRGGGGSGGRPNLALHKPTQQLGTYKHYHSGLAVDGGRNQYLTGGSCAHPHSYDLRIPSNYYSKPTWWQVDLAAGHILLKYVVEEVQIYFRIDCVECQARTSPTTIRVGNSRLIHAQSIWDTINKPAFTVTRYQRPYRAVRYLTILHDSSPDMSLCEVIVHGYRYIPCRLEFYGRTCSHACPHFCHVGCDDITGDCIPMGPIEFL